VTEHLESGGSRVAQKPSPEAGVPNLPMRCHGVELNPRGAAELGEDDATPSPDIVESWGCRRGIERRLLPKGCGPGVTAQAWRQSDGAG
jgi:hypothetical protein